jgi:hypothetical protein
MGVSAVAQQVMHGDAARKRGCVCVGGWGVGDRGWYNTEGSPRLRPLLRRE